MATRSIWCAVVKPSPISMPVSHCCRSSVVARFENPSLDEIRALLKQVRTIAVVGLSPMRNRPSHMVAEALQCFGYRIIPVRPAIDSVLGEKAYPDLNALPEKPDLVDVFRAPE